MPNKIFITDDGSHSMFSEKHGVSYHSKYGAIQETEHVFINSALRFKLPSSSLSILDIGFGSGLNAYMSYLEAEKLNLPIQYVAIEAFPISLEQAKQLNFSEELELDPADFLKLHQVEWDIQNRISDKFVFEKKLMRFEEIEFHNQFDIIFFDAFAPTAQPELWEENILQKMFNALLPKGVLTTYCAKGVVKRTFKKVGFEVQSIPGPPGKREMIRAIKN